MVRNPIYGLCSVLANLLYNVSYCVQSVGESDDDDDDDENDELGGDEFEEEESDDQAVRSSPLTRTHPLMCRIEQMVRLEKLL